LFLVEVVFVMLSCISYLYRVAVEVPLLCFMMVGSVFLAGERRSKKPLMMLLGRKMDCSTYGKKKRSKERNHQQENTSFKHA
jgi:hypothetical protein